jgi:uncharacterized protein YqgC (DUF456 family)
MNYAIAAGLVIINAVWLALVVVGLPGNWLMVVTAAGVAWWRWSDASPPGDRMFSLWTLGSIAAIALIGEVLELFAGVFGARTTGGTKWGGVGALAGGLIGGIVGTFAIPIPLLGSLIGAAAGAGLGAAALECVGGRPVDASIKAGVGAGIGRLAGTLFKFAAGIAIWLIVAVAAFWP